MDIERVKEQLDLAHRLTNQAIQALRPLTERDDDPWSIDADYAKQILVGVAVDIESMIDHAKDGAYSEAT